MLVKGKENRESRLMRAAQQKLLILFPLILIVRSCSSMEEGDKEEIKIVLNIIIRRRYRGYQDIIIIILSCS